MPSESNYRRPSGDNAVSPPPRIPSPGIPSACGGLGRILRSTAAAALVASAVATPAVAQAPVPLPEPLVTVLPVGARALALGWAAPLGLPDPATVLSQPGVVASGGRGGPAAGGVQLDYSRLTEGATSLAAAAVVPWFGGAVGLAVQSLDYSAGTLPVLADLWPGEAGTGAGGEGMAEMAASLVLGRTVGPVDIGITGRVVTQRSGDRSRTLEGLDVGVATRAGPLRVALAGRNLGTADGLASETVLGLGSGTVAAGPLDLALAGQLRVREDGEVVTGGGLEVAYWPVRGRTFVGRVGFRDTATATASPVTFGFGFRGDEIQLDYAFLSPDGDGGLHRLTVGWR